MGGQQRGGQPQGWIRQGVQGLRWIRAVRWGASAERGPHEWAQGESGAIACDRGGDCSAVATLLTAPSGGPAPPAPPLWLACSLLVGVGGWVDNIARSATTLPQLAGGSYSSNQTAGEGQQYCKTAILPP